MEKKVRRYKVYEDGLWKADILAQMKEETGFNPPPQEDNCTLTGTKFPQSFLSIVPEGKQIHIDGGDDKYLTVTVTEFIKEDGDE